MCHLPNSDCILHVKGGFGESAELVVAERTLWEVTLWLRVRAECE